MKRLFLIMVIITLVYSNMFSQAIINQVTGQTYTINGLTYRVFVDQNAATGSSGGIYMPSYSLLPLAGNWAVNFRVFPSVSDKYCLKIIQEPASPWNPYLTNGLSNKSEYRQLTAGTNQYFSAMGIICPSYSNIGSPYMRLGIFTYGLIIDTQVGEQVYNLICDATLPTSSVGTLPISQTSTVINFTGSISDGSASAGASGIWKCDIQVREDNGTWQTISSSNYTISGTTFSGSYSGGTPGHIYYFQSRAYDNVGNLESYPAGNGDASISILPSQPGTISGNTSVCQGESQTYSIAAVSGATSYTWSLPSGWSGSSSTISIIAICGWGGTISVIANSAVGSSTSRTLSVTVNTIPAIPGTISGSAAACQGLPQTYSITSVSGAISYNWTLPSGWSGSSTSISISATPGASGGTIYVSADNSCGYSSQRTKSVTVTVSPSQPGAISGNATVCQGVVQTYSITAVSGATSYTWTLPSGWSGTSTSTSISVTPGATGGTISVVANNACGSGTSSSKTLTVTALPAQPGTISGNTPVCQGVAQTYSISAVSGATSYTWILPSGWSGTSTTTSISVTPGATGGTISIIANNSCGSSSSSTLAIIMVSIPTVSTVAVTSLSPSSAASGGNVGSDGGSAITARGICWSTTANPTIALSTKTSNGTGTGSFTSTMTGLANGIYHARAYASNCAGTGYGTDLTYTNILNEVVDIETTKISVYPNPVSGMLTIDYKNEDFKTFNILNSSGILIGTEKAVKSNQQFNFSKYEPGLYILEFVKASGEIVRVKVLKNK